MKVSIYIYGLLLIQGLYSQTIVSTDTLDVNKIGQQKGLLQLNIKAMAFDDLGYLWTGTEDGLYRFNGYDFKPYFHNPKDSTSIKDDHIRCLLFTKDTLWIATNTGGIEGFVPSKNNFFDPLPLQKNKEVNTSYKVLKLGNNQLLFSVKNNMIVFNRFTKESAVISLPKSPKENYITDVLQIDHNKYWLATTATGVLNFNNKNFQLSNTNILQGRNIQCFYKQGHQIFIGTNKGLFVYDLKSNRTIKTSFTPSVKCFYQKNNKQLYLGTDNGLFLYHIDKSEITSIVLKTKTGKLFKVIDINQITGDNKGNLWIGTEAKGLIHHNLYQKKFHTVKLHLKEYPLIDNISVFQFLKEKDSTLWIGSKYGIVKYSSEKNVFKLYKSTNNQLIYTIIKDKNNTIWAGGFTTGLLKYNKKQDRFNRISKTSNSLPDDDVIEIIPVDHNTLWVCTWSGGIQKFNIKEERFEELLIDGNKISRARTSLIDSKGNIWLGTDNGVYKISKKGDTKRYYNQDGKERKLSNNRIFSIQEDRDENIWFGTSVGLTKLNVNNNKTTLFFKQEGLPNDFIYSVLIAHNNNVWVSTNYGISVLDSKTNTFKNYTINDGLQNNEFNGKAGYKDDFGNFYFGGIAGINIFNPGKIKENPFVPEVYIESVDLFNKPLQKNELFKDFLEFKSDENVITFNFSALNYLNPEKSDYTYKLEGFDKNWRPVTKDRSATYTNLDAGNYTFKVKASNDAGVWNAIPDFMNIHIIPPWYQTNLFRGFLVTLFLLIGPLFYFYKTYRLRKDKLKLEQIIANRTKEISLKNKDLKQVNSKIEEQNKRIQFLMREMSHRIKNNLQIISSLLNIQASTITYKPAVEALKVARNRILAISLIENKKATEGESYRIDFFIKELTNNIVAYLSDSTKPKFNIIYDLPQTQIKNLNTTLIGLILNELITNTIKYAFDEYHPDNVLKITCKINEKFLKLIVSDNGIGYSNKNNISSKSLGMELVTQMVEQLNGTIIINSKNGAKNTIEIPV